MPLVFRMVESKSSEITSANEGKNIPVTVAMVEDNVAFSDKLKTLIERSEDIQCIGQYSSAGEALHAIPQNPPDIVLADIKMPRVNGIECVRQLRILCPDVDVLMLTAYEQSELIFGALSAGAVGYILKQAPSSEIVAAIREAKHGGSPMTGHIARKVVQAFQLNKNTNPEEAQLAPRERQVLELLAKGLYDKEIADALKIGVGTVRTHIRRIYRKLHVRSRTEVVAKHFKTILPSTLRNRD